VGHAELRAADIWSLSKVRRPGRSPSGILTGGLGPSGANNASLPLMKSLTSRAIGLAGLCIALAILAITVPAGAAARAKITESYAAFQGQIKGGKVRRVTFNKKAHTAHITLTSGKHELVSYPSHDEPQIAASLQAKGAAVKVQKAKKTTKPAVHHKLRYIAGGVLVVLIVIVAVVLGLNRRRPQADEPAGARAGAPAAAPPPGPDAPPPQA
jgi:ATP-dependent Zn protease